MSSSTPTESPKSISRQILALAVPALGALIAEPLFLMADSAIVGHLGVNELAGAALGTTVLQTAVGLMIFLAYATTPAVARAIGAEHTYLTHLTHETAHAALATELPPGIAPAHDGLVLEVT